MTIKDFNFTIVLLNINRNTLIISIKLMEWSIQQYNLV